MLRVLPCLLLLLAQAGAFRAPHHGSVVPLSSAATLPRLARHAPATSVAKAKLVPFLLFGKTSSELFAVQNLSLLSWALYLFLPRWKVTPVLALVAPIVHSLLYSKVLFHLIQNPAPGIAVSFSSLAGIMPGFTVPDGAFVGWLHYCAFDPLIGLAIVMDAKKQRVPHLLCVPCIVATALIGPVGFLSYLLLRTFVKQQRRLFPPQMMPPKGFQWAK